MKKIGIPRGLLYHKYGFFWKSFFKNLGYDVKVSPETNKEIMDKGLSIAVDESCLSAKIFLGHVNYLIGKVDYIFIPRFVSLYRKESLCTKFWGMYDIVNNTFEDISLIDCNIDVRNLKFPFFSYFFLGVKMTKNPFKSLIAYYRAKKEEENYLKEGEKKQEERLNAFDKKKPTILITSHPYTTYDAMLGKPIISMLESLDVNIIYSDKVNRKNRKLSEKISTDLYWSFNKDILSSIEYYKEMIDGLVFLVTFPCGPDSFVVNICQHKLKTPMLVLTLDELYGEAGIKTRIESFTDILKLKKNGRS